MIEYIFETDGFDHYRMTGETIVRCGNCSYREKGRERCELLSVKTLAWNTREDNYCCWGKERKDGR